MDLLYADDLVLICENEDDLNKVVQCFEEMTQKWALTISVKKTKKLITKVDDQAVYADGLLEIRGEKVERVPVFTYLGSEISESGSCTLEIEKRIRLGHFKFQQLSKAVYNLQSAKHQHEDKVADLPSDCAHHGVVRIRGVDMY